VRFAIVLIYLLGFKRSEISRTLKFCQKTVHVNIKKYNLHGFKGILEKPCSGRKGFLTEEESLKIKTFAKISLQLKIKLYMLK
jgi:transposase